MTTTSETPEHASVPHRRPRRGLWATLLVVALLWLGLVVGTVVGGWLFVPAGSGLAGPANALSLSSESCVDGAVSASDSVVLFHLRYNLRLRQLVRALDRNNAL